MGQITMRNVPHATTATIPHTMIWWRRKTKSKWVVFDLDGTLCDISHRLYLIKRDKPLWEAFNEACSSDLPRRREIELLKTLYKAGYKIALFTGRSASFKPETEDWLFYHGIKYDTLQMRAVGDRRSDSAVKKEYLESAGIKPEQVLFVVEDRDRVVQMWRDLGILCLQNVNGAY